MMAPTIKVDEWLNELAKLSKKSDRGFTVNEWAERMKRTPKTALAMLHKARALGWLRVGQRTVTNLLGREYQAPVYWVEKPKR
jgi:Mn-dependent DtxR family transcriptional regulator